MGAQAEKKAEEAEQVAAKKAAVKKAAQEKIQASNEKVNNHASMWPTAAYVFVFVYAGLFDVLDVCSVRVLVHGLLQERDVCVCVCVFVCACVRARQGRKSDFASKTGNL